MAQLMARTWLFDMPLSVDALSDQYENLNTAHARLKMRGLES